MAKSATVKDVLYALEHAKLELVGFNNTVTGSGGLRWALSDGTPVTKGVADEARMHAGLTPYSGVDGNLRYYWDDAA